MKKKVLLYLASNSIFYTNLYPSIKRGFEEAGCEVEGGANLLKPEKLIQKIEQFKPDFVFEMNRVKSEIKNFPKDVIHICWLVDFWGRIHEELGGSDILYTWAEDWIKYFKRVGIKSVLYLPPATDASIYKPLKIEKENDFIFLGHISKQWTHKELNREIGYHNNNIILFKELLPYIEKHVLSQNIKIPFLDSLKEKKIILNTPIEKSLLYDISNRTFRQTRREHYINLFLKDNHKLAIYGSENWLLYKNYKSFYKGYIDNFSDINIAMSKSNVLLHDGNCPHFRTFDAMASGIVVAAAQPPESFKSPWKDLGFKDKEDYLNIDIYNADIDTSIFKDKAKLQNIAQNARKKVLENHLWVHRVYQVLDDISKLK